MKKDPRKPQGIDITKPISPEDARRAQEDLGKVTPVKPISPIVRPTTPGKEESFQ